MPGQPDFSNIDDSMFPGGLDFPWRQQWSQKDFTKAVSEAEISLRTLRNDYSMGVGDEALEELKEPGIVPRFVMILPTMAFQSNCEWRWLEYKSSGPKKRMVNSKLPWLSAFAYSISEVIMLTDDMVNVYVFYDFHGILPLAHLHPTHKSTQIILKRFKSKSKQLILGEHR